MGDTEVLGMLGAMMGIYSLVMFAYSVFLIVCQWKMFEKAGQPGWAAIVPFYNTYKLFEISYGDGWKMLLLLIPIVNIFVLIQQSLKLAKAFGQSTAFGVGLIFLGPIFQTIIAFSKNIYYVGPFDN